MICCYKLSLIRYVAYFNAKCSAIGPKVKAGKNASAAIMMITAKIIIPKVDVSLFSVPADSGINFLLASIPAMATGPMIGRKRPSIIIKPALTFQNILLSANPSKPEPLLAAATADGQSHNDSCGTIYSWMMFS